MHCSWSEAVYRALLESAAEAVPCAPGDECPNQSTAGGMTSQHGAPLDSHLMHGPQAENPFPRHTRPLRCTATKRDAPRELNGPQPSPLSPRRTPPLAPSPSRACAPSLSPGRALLPYHNQNTHAPEAPAPKEAPLRESNTTPRKRRYSKTSHSAACFPAPPWTLRRSPSSLSSRP